jgi:CDP-diacylglycerol--serine O-phosphatidyltransferase
MNIKAFFPNLLTGANLFTGLAGIVMAFTGDYTNSIFFIILAGLFDFLDGFVARLLKVSGDFGKELDSLADVISFGALPSVYMFLFLQNQYQNQYIPYLSLMIGVFSALRLAKFNLDDQQSDKFIGLPTPANAIFICTIGQLPESILQLSNIGIY